ncbi:hypothetical protein Bca101_019726 [Brassica carinata]
MSQAGGECEGNIVNVFLEEKENQDDENDNNSVQLRFTRGEEEGEKDNKNDLTKELKSKKRTRTSKTSVEVESQRTTYIAVVKGTGGGEGLREETRENKSCLADVEVELLSLMP